MAGPSTRATSRASSSWRRSAGTAGGRSAPADRQRLDFGEGKVVIVDVAQRRHPRQQQRPTFRLADEGHRQRPAGAAGRQEDPGVGHRFRRLAQTQPQARRQGIDEGQARGDGEDLGLDHASI